ncbi:SAM-dependent MidA family methyltransferase [Bosea sp. 62]|uniref:class I SAM-dependent methyltransferase n=1 Tax=unclassified Bosea (in: a-proteobacteria) TaxID=2653178 RepID=UPI001253A9C9|nr:MULTISPECIES: SAM-dependent methyltransferase [unclassified Bosea (in: a-proteobacteria)]CAD5246982.1 SAM-dependent MidA family methyltransferase [Bosea sp. 46]CAD5248821.1 SAM-dependent MidA family methyltransferase [Bosea sp. 21B]CAD5267312.1 SAM-dependent MidA family methyltransferase [Bosea sp. 7B]VVT45319.1 SAM-dependent methyltransferase, MidA family [Bosea sp. EC-HK365B]VXA96629.1 SAM-dependent MidA family methyltransferase [Bosea sp. 29B]
MSLLAQELAELIRQEGPLSVSRYMALCLGHPRHGYYMKQDPFGADGDFTTAPEISQIFGELIGLWATSVWQAMGAPASIRLVELGPGRGTLMQDMLRATRALPGFRDALSVHLVEMSPVLRERQRQTLAASGAEPRWHDRIDQALEGPAIIVANEFLDALPLDQFVRTPEGWRERLVGLDEEGRLAFGLAGETDSSLSVAAPVGSVLEQPAAASEAVATVARHVATQGGAGLFIDYGPARSGFGDTLQGLKHHAFVDVLAEPGDADLTVHVDFARMAQAGLAAAAAAHGAVTQRDFLLALGLQQRFEALSRRASSAQAQTLASGVERLIETGPTAMGELFKVLAVAERNLPLLPGFDLHRLPEQG